MSAKNKADLCKKVLFVSRQNKWAKHMGVPLEKWTRRKLTTMMMDQLDGCKDEASRRILLGISR